MSIVDSIYFAFKVYGIVIVISFLCAFVIWAVVHTLSAVAKKGPASQPLAKTVPAPASAPAPLPASEPVPVVAPLMATPELVAAAVDVPPEHVAAIAAAVAVVGTSGIPAEHVAAIAAAVSIFADGAIVLHIEDNRRSSWVVEGRLAHHSSHSPSRKR